MLPTGAGKTLIAAMLLHHLWKVHQKLGLLIVDRLPLIDQHTSVIEYETELVVANLSGNTGRFNSSCKMAQVLVATAGALVNAFETGDMTPHSFSCVVFDECHHVVGSHSYTRILKKFLEQCGNDGPRILGLTASPVKATSVSKAQEGLKEVREAFGSEALWYRPKSTTPFDLNTKWVIITDSEKQMKRREEILKIMGGMVNGLRSQVCQSYSDPLRCNSLHKFILNSTLLHCITFYVTVLYLSCLFNLHIYARECSPSASRSVCTSWCDQ